MPVRFQYLLVAAMLLCIILGEARRLHIESAEAHQMESVAPGAIDYPYGPDDGDKKDKLPFSSGAILNLRSKYYDAFCTVGTKDDKIANALGCTAEKEQSSSKGFLLIGKDMTTQDIVDGSTVYLKSQSEFKFCSIGPANEGSYVTCKQMHYNKDSEFVVRKAGSKGGIRLHPADSPHSWCHVEKGSSHVVRCGGKAEYDRQVFIASSSGYGPGGGGDYPSGGGDYPSSGGDYPSGGGDYPSGGGDYPSGGGDYPGGGYIHAAPSSEA